MWVAGECVCGERMVLWYVRWAGERVDVLAGWWCVVVCVWKRMLVGVVFVEGGGFVYACGLAVGRCMWRCAWRVCVRWAVV